MPDNKYNRTQNSFTPTVKAMELADYVITITDNINKFPDFIEKERKHDDGTVMDDYVESLFTEGA